MKSGMMEDENVPRYRLMITRHAERLPSGELSPEGIEHAKKKGAIMQNAEVLKAYASDHKSGRAIKTGDLISKESRIKSELTGEQYPTRTVKDIQYDILEPDLYHLIPKLKLIIEVPTLAEAFLIPELKKQIDEAVDKDRAKIVCKQDSNGNPMIDMEKLPVDIQMQIAPLRQKNQKKGFEKFLNEYPEAVHRLAMGLGHQLAYELKIAAGYADMRDMFESPPQKDVILNTATHGLFTESLLREAGIFVQPDGQEILGIQDFQSAEIGGFIQPAEAIYLDIDDPSHVPNRIPVSFEGTHRPQSGRVFIDRKKLEKLDQDYLEWKKTSTK